MPLTVWFRCNGHAWAEVADRVIIACVLRHIVRKVEAEAQTPATLAHIHKTEANHSKLYALSAKCESPTFHLI